MKVKYTKLQIFFEVLCALALIGMLIFVVVRWGQLPDKIPTHFNFAGEIDKWGSKTEFLFLPGIGVFLYLLLTTMSCAPKIWNIPAKVTEENKTAVYRCTKDMLIILKTEMVLVFWGITYFTAESAAIPWVFMVGMLVVLLGSLIYLSIRISRVGRLKQ